MAKTAQKIQVNFLGFMAAIDQYKDVDQVGAVAQIMADHFGKGLPLNLAHPGVAIARKIHQAPGSLVHFEQVDKLGFTRLTRCFGQTLMVGQHVDQGRLAHIRATNEGVLRHVHGGAFLGPRSGLKKLRFDVN